MGRETEKSTSGRHIEGIDLKVSARSENLETSQQSKRTKAPVAGRLAQLEEDHVVHSDIFGSFSCRQLASQVILSHPF